MRLAQDSGTRGTVSTCELLRILDCVAARLASPLTPGEIAALVGARAREALGAQAVAVLVALPERRRLVLAFDAGLSDAARRSVSRLEHLAHRGRPLYLHGLRRTAPDGLAALGDSLAVVPIVRDERALGVVMLGWSTTCDFPVEVRAFLGVLATECGLALEVRRLAASPPAVGDLRLDLGHQRALIAGRPVHLTPSELRLLSLLAEQPGRARTRREIVEHLWETDPVGGERMCDTHVRNLRLKIERDPSRPDRLLTVRGIGYALHAG